MTTSRFPSWTAEGDMSDVLLCLCLPIVIPASIFLASSTPLSVKTFARSFPGMGSLRGTPPLARMSVSYGTRSWLAPTMTSFVDKSTPETSVPVRRLIPYLDRSSAAGRHSSFDGSVTRALLNLVLHSLTLNQPTEHRPTEEAVPVNWRILLFRQNSYGALVSMLLILWVSLFESRPSFNANFYLA